MSILVIDDQPSLILAVVRPLHATHKVTIAFSGDEALERLMRGEQYEAIISDVCMRGMGGLEFAEWIAVEFPVYSRRLILWSGTYDPQLRDEMDRLNVRCLRKPVRPAELMAALREIGLKL